jgi:hypothetical protein
MSKSRRDPLRELSRKLPPNKETSEFLRKLHVRGDDRSLAIVGAAFLEAQLEKLLIKKLPSVDSRLEGRLFKNRGPLADFDSKILIATALGLISNNAASALGSIRAVRNTFAHSIVDITFDTKEVADEMNRQIPHVVSALDVLTSEDNKKPKEPSGWANKNFKVLPKRHIFQFLLQLLSIMLSDASHDEKLWDDGLSFLSNTSILRKMSSTMSSSFPNRGS